MRKNGIPAGFMDWLIRTGKYQDESLMEKIFNALKK